VKQNTYYYIKITYCARRIVNKIMSCYCGLMRYVITILFIAWPINSGSVSIYSPELWDAMAYVESNCGKYIVGDDGKSLGKYQVQLTTARELGFTGTRKQLRDPMINFVYAFALLSKLYRRYDGDIYSALRAYNSGPGSARKGKSYKNSAYVKKIFRAISKRIKCP
jgi:hypothetical protein